MEKRIILVSHGKLSEGMAHSVQMICGENEELFYYGMMPGEHYSMVADAVKEQALEHPDIQYLIIADLKGGSVCNGCTELVDMENVKLISGMNIGLVIELMFEEAPVSDETIEEKLVNCKEAMIHITPDYIHGATAEEEAFF